MRRWDEAQVTDLAQPDCSLNPVSTEHQVSLNFSRKVQIENILDFASLMVSVIITQFCH